METDSPRITSASREVRAPSSRIFDLIADPSIQPQWDGNDNLAHAEPGQRVHSVGDIFEVTLTNGSVRENLVVEFVEGQLIAWEPAEPGKSPPGHLWRWELKQIDESRTFVVRTYDWTKLEDESRLDRARSTTTERLAASIDRLAAVFED